MRFVSSFGIFGAVCVCVSTSVTKRFECRGRDGRFPSHANEAMEIDCPNFRTCTFNC